MSAMRVLALLAAALVATAALSGCMGGTKDPEAIKPNDLTPTPGTGTGMTGGNAPQIKVLQPLAATITLDGPAWVQSGTDVPASVSAPSKANGTVLYTWAIGPRPGTSEVKAAPADTGTKPADFIDPGEVKSLTYSVSGIYRMHCHPHPDMRHNVTVIDGYAGPKAVEVLIVDGARPADYRYFPENIVVGVGTVVSYKNIGSQPHTATALGAQEPALKALPLKAANGTIKVEGEGWQRVLAVFTDADGRLGFAEKPIYATATLPAFPTTEIPFDFTYGTPGPLAGTPVEAAAKTAPVVLEQAGTVTLNYTFADALGGAGAPENLAEVEIHFTKDGETQDTLTGGPAPVDSLSGKAIPGAYTLSVKALQGVQVSGTVIVEVVYDLVPPEPTMPSAAPAGDGHGHAH